MLYRVYYSGDGYWIIQNYEEGQFRTLDAVHEISISVPCRLPRPEDGPKPNGVLLVEGHLHITVGRDGRSATVTESLTETKGLPHDRRSSSGST